jgi:EmrB/QacA subfamily drug resistance transporter
MKMAIDSQKNNRWYVLATLCVVLFIISIDNTVLNLALPSISTALNASASQLQWIVDTYTLIFASILITTGTLGDRYGRKKLLIIGLVLFGLGSLGAAFSVSTLMLIIFRGLLGIAGALIMPSTLSILNHVFIEKRERTKAFAIWSSIFSIGAGIGPIVGGLLINAFHWSSVFFLNVPIVAIGLAGTFLFIPESKDENAPSPDFPGVALSVVGLFALIAGTIQAGELGWTAPRVLIEFGIALVFLFGFVMWEKYSPRPMLPLEFFKIKAFTGANVALTISAFAMMGSMFFFSQFLQSVRDYTPILAAVGMFPMTISVFSFTMLSVRIFHRMGVKFTMSLGLLIMGAALFIFAATVGPQTSYWSILLVQIVLGSGIGLSMSPATNTIMSSLPPNRAGIGSAMNDTTRQLGGALGIAVLGALSNRVYRSEVSSLSSVSGLSESVLGMIRGSIQTAHNAVAALNGDMGSFVLNTAKQAFSDGMRDALLVGGAMMVVSALAAWFLLPKREGSPLPIENSVDPETPQA